MNTLRSHALSFRKRPELLLSLAKVSGNVDVSYLSISPISLSFCSLLPPLFLHRCLQMSLSLSLFSEGLNSVTKYQYSCCSLSLCCCSLTGTMLRESNWFLFLHLPLQPLCSECWLHWWWPNSCLTNRILFLSPPPEWLYFLSFCTWLGTGTFRGLCCRCWPPNRARQEAIGRDTGRVEHWCLGEAEPCSRVGGNDR